MRQIDRFSLIDKIGRELQSRMTYGDIDTYLAGFGVEVKPKSSSYGSKWVYSKELLANTPAQTLVQIANELGVPHGYAVVGNLQVGESRFWEANHFRLFVSHLSSFKERTGRLQISLRRFSISAFVAHVDIEPTKEWQDEIEAALFSMDALAAILMPGFKESSWTDQEVGVAIGRDVLIVPIMRGSTPHGFIGKFQGLNAMGKTVDQVAGGLFQILTASPKTRSRMLTCLVDTTTQATSETDGLARLAVLKSVKDLPVGYVERLREGAVRSQVFGGSPSLSTALNELLRSRDVPEFSPEAGVGSGSDDEIPF